MRKLLSWIVDHPLPTAIVLVLSSALFFSHLGSIEFDSSAEGLMVEKDPARDYYEESKKMFGDDNLTVVMVKTEDVFTSEILQLVREVTDAVTVLDGVTRVESLVTVNRIKGEGEFLNTDPLVDYVPGPEEVKELQRIRRDALGNYIFINNVVSKDAKTTAINIYNESRPKDKDFNRRLASQIEEVVKGKKGNFEIYQIGYPLTKTTFSQFIQNDMVTFIPLAGFVLLTALFFSFRSPVGMAVPLATALLSIGWTLGFMSWLGYPVNVITSTVPAILIAVGSTEDTHIIAEYFQALKEGRPKRDAIHHAMQSVALPIFLTSLTTILGFGSIAINKITILKQFGIVSAFGLFANFLITLMVVPTILNILGAPRRPREKTTEGKTKSDFLDNLLHRMGGINLHNKRAVGIITVVLTLISLAGISMIVLNNDFISFFKKSSFIRVRTDDAHDRLAGMLNFYTVIETHRENGLKEPAVLKQVADLQSFINTVEGVDKTTSLADYVKVMNREMNNGDKKFEAVPDNEQLIAQYILLMDQSQIGKYTNYNYATGNIFVRHNISSSWELSRVLEGIKKYAAENMTRDLAVKFTGEGILINSAADSMAAGQVYSLSIALTTIFIIMTILFTSFKAGFLSLIPNSIPIILNFGLMGWFGIPLNAGTCMVAAIALGIAVDDTVHMMVRYNREMKVSGEQSENVLYNCLQGEGRPIIFTSIALFFGFGILVFSNFNPDIQFGYLAALVMVYALLADLLLTPVLLSTTQLISLWDVIGTKLAKDITKVSPLFQGMKNIQARRLVSLGGLVNFKGGDQVIKQGQEGNEMYVILNGRARVTVDTPQGTRELQILKQGDIFGEMALLQKTVRSANVVAVDDAELLKIDNKSLDRISKRLPRVATIMYANISRILSDRLRQQNIQVRG
ncbi:MAG: MMPL family transporter [Candidatus Binatia bacterium]